jgi:hypothetical protein
LDRGVGAIEVNTSAENVPQRDDAEAINLVTALEDAFGAGFTTKQIVPV